MKNTLFSAKSPLLKPFIWAADILILSVLWTLCSILVVTAGAASTAAYDCAAHCMIGGEGELIRRFFRTFKRELKQSCLSVVLWAFFLSTAVLLLMKFLGDGGNMMAAYALAFLLALLVGVMAWVFPLLSRFTFHFSSLQGTAVKMAVAYLPRTVGLIGVNIASVWICSQFLMPLLVVPGLAALLSALLLEPVFRQYEAAEEEKNGIGL